MLSIIGFLVILGPLVIFHEFGHYIFARIFNVKAEVFSVGFGPKVWAKQFGETEWRISAFPLGGYVKLLGEDAEAELSPEDQKRALQKQVPWKRFCIFFGGPLFNFILASLIFSTISAIGEPQLSSRIGRVVHGTLAEKAGFRSGDRILTVNGTPVRKFEEVVAKVGEHPGRPVEMEVLHSGENVPAKVSVVPSAEEGFSVYGEVTQVGDIEGLMATGRSTRAGVSNPKSLAYLGGFRTGDLILTVGGMPVKSWEEIEAQYARLPAGEVVFGLINNVTRKVQKPTASRSLDLDQGLYSSELFVDKVMEGAPAAKAGLRSGDRLISVGGTVVQSFFALRQAVQKAGEHHGKVDLIWEREGQQMQVSVVPTATKARDALLNKTTQFTIGFTPQLVWAEADTFIERTWNPFVLAYQGVERMFTVTWRNLVSIGKMFRGDVSVKTLGGPILIGKIAGESMSRGLVAFLTTMAILSVGLGVLNLLPVPVLDGGHLMLLMLESIRGKPLSLRQMEIVQQVGLSLILLLMVIVLRNDVTRLPFFN